MKVGIITFHASHNYGSMLQAYALQQTIIGLGHECEIINFRTERQHRLYRPFFFQRRWQSWIKAILIPKFAYGEWRKYNLFEKFIAEKYKLTQNVYTDDDQLRNAILNFDVYVSGSDQIWNTHCFDFDWAYYLDFVRQGRRVAYAPSMGPHPESEVTSENNDRIASCVKLYDYLSVRERLTAIRIDQASGIKINTIALDPTLLLSRSHWETLANDKPIIKGKYIFMYSPWYNKEILLKSVTHAEMLKMKVVVTRSNKALEWIKYRNIKFYTSVGPIEFLNIIRYSDLVVADSFHAVVFSIIFGRKVALLDKTHDSRVTNLFKICGIDEDYLKSHEIIDCASLNLYQKLAKQIDISIDFLKKGLL